MKTAFLAAAIVTVAGLVLFALSGTRDDRLARENRSTAIADSAAAQTAAGEMSENSNIASAKKDASIKIERGASVLSAPASGTGGAGSVLLVIDLTLLTADHSKPYALELTSACNEKCKTPDASKTVSLGQLSIFPALKAGESRVLPIAVASETAAKLSGHLQVKLKPVVVGRGVGANSVRINSVAIKMSGR